MRKKTGLVLLIIGGLIVGKNRYQTKELDRAIKSVSMEKEIEKEVSKEKRFFVRDLGEVETRFSIDIGDKKGMLSRDGSQAVSVKTGQIIEKAGTYFLTVWNEKDEQIEVIKWTIKNKAWEDTWVIEQEEELEEILKQALEERQTDFSMYLKLGQLTLEEVNEILFKVIEELLMKYPRLTFDAYTLVGQSGENPEVKLQMNYPKGQEDWIKDEHLLDKKIIEILDGQLLASMKDYEREWAIYEYLIEQVTYSAQMVDGVRTVIDTPLTHTMYGSLIQGVAVCDGYAKALMYLLNAAGVPAQLLSGTADGTPHVWNIVQIEEKNYHVDATWGDQENQQLGGFYDYFNESDTYMLQTHKWDTSQTLSCNQEEANFLNLLLPIEQVKKVTSQEEWKKLREILNEKNELSICFANRSREQWELRTLVSEICFATGKSIEYNVVEKYDYLIINYRVYEE